MSEDKSIFERLDNIEERLTPKEPQEPRTVSDMIGEPFDAYLKKSTVYYYEPDERKFNKARKEQIKSQSN